MTIRLFAEAPSDQIPHTRLGVLYAHVKLIVDPPPIPANALPMINLSSHQHHPTDVIEPKGDLDSPLDTFRRTANRREDRQKPNREIQHRFPPDDIGHSAIDRGHESLRQKVRLCVETDHQFDVRSN